MEEEGSHVVEGVVVVVVAMRRGPETRGRSDGKKPSGSGRAEDERGGREAEAVREGVR